MSTCYWVLHTDSMFHLGPFVGLPEGVRLAGPELAAKYPVRPSVPHVPPGAWVLVEDDDAPPELDGRQVELLIHVRGGVPEVETRSEVTR